MSGGEGLGSDPSDSQGASSQLGKLIRDNPDLQAAIK